MNTFIQNAVADYIQKQTFYQKNANTIHASIGVIIAVGTAIIGQDLPISNTVTNIIAAGLAALTMLSVKLAPNGIQPKTADKLESTTTVQQAQAAPGNSIPDLSSVAGSLPTYMGPTVADAAEDILPRLQAEAEKFTGRHHKE